MKAALKDHSVALYNSVNGTEGTGQDACELSSQYIHNIDGDPAGMDSRLGPSLWLGQGETQKFMSRKQRHVLSG